MNNRADTIAADIEAFIRTEVIPYENSVQFAKARGATLHLVESDHRLHSALPLIRSLFQHFLIELDILPPME